MHHLWHRTLGPAVLAPALSLLLAACGSVAVNTSGIDESLSPYPSASPQASSTSASSQGPSTGATTTNSAHATATASHSTPATSGPGGARSSAPSKAPTFKATFPASGPACVWQSGAPNILVTPCTNLTSGQTVTVRARGLHPGWGVIAIECHYRGTATDQNDCDLSGAGGLGTLLAGGNQPNADGTITLTLTVNKTFQGGGGQSFTCSRTVPCIVAVTSPQHTSENNTAPISFR